MDAMLTHTMDELKEPLTKEVVAGKDDDSVRRAVMQFKNIMGYMGDRPSMYSDVFIDEVVRLALEWHELQVSNGGNGVVESIVQ